MKGGQIYRKRDANHKITNNPYIKLIARVGEAVTLGESEIESDLNKSKVKLLFLKPKPSQQNECSLK